jgi:hypothetical protein
MGKRKRKANSMTKDDIIKGNRLIAEFMGLVPVDVFGSFSVSHKHCTCNEATAEEAMDGFSSIAKYHESWNWLMPVASKISYKNYDMGMNGNDVLDKQLDNSLLTFSIGNVWESCVEFIEWFNER